MNCISFILDGHVHEIDFVRDGFDPTTTVLNYLRSLSHHKGVKEGCAEGDCGACTIVLAETDGQENVRYRAFDSCLLFLPMIHGKQLITVENVGNSGDMHPVQKAMVDTDGSQCGYCTPGFIMSMFALYKNTEHPSRAKIEDALTGNLCRCTGYRPIIEATARACVNGGVDKFSPDEKETFAKLKQIASRKESIEINTGSQQYVRPCTLREALRLRKEHPDALLINGATDVALRVTKNREQLPKILDLSRLEEIKDASETDAFVRYGAGLSLEEVKRLSEQRFPALFDMLAVFGSVQIRNVATLGGNLGTASPIGDTPPVLMAYEASVELESETGVRLLPLHEFISGYRQTLIRDDELITAILIPQSANGDYIKSYKISKRKDLDISTVSAGFRLNLNGSGRIDDIKLYYGGMAAMTKRATLAESFLNGKSWNRKTVEQAMDLIDEDFAPISDARSGAAGRSVMARNLLLKFWVDSQQNVG